jgi:Mg2+-importing ATPase
MPRHGAARERYEDDSRQPIEPADDGVEIARVTLGFRGMSTRRASDGRDGEATPRDKGTGRFWALAVADAMERVESGAVGLTAVEAKARLARVGPNLIRTGGRRSDVGLLIRQFESPIVLILVFATAISGVLGDATDAVIILAIIALSGLLGFWQERGATRAVAALLAVVQVKVEVRRDGQVVEVPSTEIVPGDLVLLNAGDVIPGDGLIVETNALLVDEAALTGETYPAEKAPGVVPGDAPIARRTNSVFMGTHVTSGSGTALIVRTGDDTEFGKVSARLRARPAATTFERGMTAFGYLLVRVMLVLVAAVFVVNLILARPLVDSALFSLALAVGLTPQLLPAIVTISLSQGARLMARERVIVKRLDAIEDFGAMTILCTDKTGTMTSGTIKLEGTFDAGGIASDRVRQLAYLNARLQTGFTNPIDAAIVAATSGPDRQRLAELPYDFRRRRLSVLVAGVDDDDASPGPNLMITKGALEDVLRVCSTARGPGRPTVEIATVLASARAKFSELSGQGYRVLGIATRELAGRDRLTQADEAGMNFEGFLTFLDPPKPDAAATIADLAASGISVRMVTGDNRLAAAHIGRLVGLDADDVLTGDRIESLSDLELVERAARTAIFAEIEPTQKERIISALRAAGSTVGYLGDGINDAPALHAADVGISVDTAVDVAKESAAIVLLDKDLRVLRDGVRQGRRTFANTMKYVFTTTSANFGNMLSMAGAAALLPYLPLLADQILLINFLTDFPATTIATDRVDPEQLDRPHSWDLGFVRSFMIGFGLVSSAFDFLTFGVLRLGFGADATLFRSGWFLESVATELAVLFVLRTRRPFIRSQPSRLLAAASLGLLVVTLIVLYSPLGALLGLEPLPPAILGALGLITVGYVTATEIAKRAFYRSNVGS